MADDSTYQFNWRGTEGKDQFLSWLLPEVLVGMSDFPTTTSFEHMAELTSDFTDVRITMQVNGVEISPEPLLRNVHMNMDYRAKQEAVRIVRDIPRLEQLKDQMEAIDRTLRRELRTTLRDAGIDVYDFGDEEDHWD